jgi:hypothetical protein
MKYIRMLIIFYGCVPTFNEAKPIKNLWTTHGPHMKGSFSHLVHFGSHFLEFYAEVYIQALFCTFGCDTYNTQHKHCSLLVMTVSV